MNLLADSVRRNTRWFVNALADLSDVDASIRAGEATNNTAFLALHLVDVRFFLAHFVGVVVSNPYDSMLSNVTSMDQIATLPPVAELRSVWLDVSPPIEKRIEALTPAELAEPAAQRFPLTDATRGAGIAFLLQHEMYHIGQIALLRRYVGRSAMKWT